MKLTRPQAIIRRMDAAAHGLRGAMESLARTLAIVDYEHEEDMRVFGYSRDPVPAYVNLRAAGARAARHGWWTGPDRRADILHKLHNLCKHRFRVTARDRKQQPPGVPGQSAQAEASRAGLRVDENGRPIGQAAPPWRGAGNVTFAAAAYNLVRLRTLVATCP